MHGSKLADPPAIVAEAPLDEHQLVEAIATAAIRDNFAVGRYALQWHILHSRKKSDAALAKLVNEANHFDEEVSREYIEACRRVATVVATRVATLSWTHHRIAVNLDKKNAQAWLDKAEKKGWSKRQLEDAILRTITHGGKIRQPQGHRAHMRELREFMRDGDMLASRSYLRQALKDYAIPLSNEGKRYIKKLKAIKRNVDFLLEKLPMITPVAKRKEG